MLRDSADFTHAHASVFELAEHVGRIIDTCFDVLGLHSAGNSPDADRLGSLEAADEIEVVAAYVH